MSNERPDYQVWRPADAPTITVWPPAEWLDTVIREAIAEYVKEDGLFRIRGDTLSLDVWWQSECLVEKRVSLSAELADAIEGGDELPKLRGVLVEALRLLDQTLAEHPDWADEEPKG